MQTLKPTCVTRNVKNVLFSLLNVCPPPFQIEEFTENKVKFNKTLALNGLLINCWTWLAQCLDQVPFSALFHFAIVSVKRE